MFTGKRMFRFLIVFIVILMLLAIVIVVWVAIPYKLRVTSMVNTTGEGGMSVVWGPPEPKYSNPMIIEGNGEEVGRIYVLMAPPSPYPVITWFFGKDCRPYKVFEEGNMIEVRTPKLWFPYFMADSFCAKHSGIPTFHGLFGDE